METELIFRIGVFVVLMVLSACFSASETAFFSLSRARVQSLQKESSWGKRVAFLMERPRRLIISILMGNETVNVAASAIFTGAVVLLLDEGKTWLAPVLMTPLLMVFGEITPKSVAARFPESFSRALVLPLYWFTKIIFPVRWIFLLIANGVLALFGVRTQTQSNILMEDEYLTLVEAGLEEGALDATERAYIHNIFEFHDRTVGEITIPRTDMVCWEADLPLSEAIGLVRNAPHSRIPVYEEDRDHVVGILYVKDFLRMSQQNSVDPVQRLTKKMLREPLFVPEGMKLDALFRLLRQKRTHLAIVADEYGGVAGLVTMKDLLEEIFGEIRDEYDADEETAIQPLSDGSFVCQAGLPLWEFSEKTGWPLPEDTETNTVGGLVFATLGQVPVTGEKIRCGAIEFTVLEMDKTRVIRVRAEKPEEIG
jgi:putative hemolysin